MNIDIYNLFAIRKKGKVDRWGSNLVFLSCTTGIKSELYHLIVEGNSLHITKLYSYCLYGPKSVCFYSVVQRNFYMHLCASPMTTCAEGALVLMLQVVRARWVRGAFLFQNVFQQPVPVCYLGAENVHLWEQQLVHSWWSIIRSMSVIGKVSYQRVHCSGHQLMYQLVLYSEVLLHG